MMMRDYSSLAAGVLVACLLATPATAQPCPPAVTQVAAQVASLDGLTGLEIPCEQIPSDQLGARLRRVLERELDAPLELEVEALLRLGIFDGDDAATVANQVVDFYASQVLGFYDASTRAMVVVEGATGDLTARMVLGHELEHAAQDIRFGLPGRVERLAANGDAQRAAAAVAEGEAVMVMVEVMAGGGRLSGADLDAGAGEMLANLGDLTPELPGVPPFLVAETLFPYTEGTRLVVHALKAGGWPAVEGLERDPPASTEQILHPDRRNDPPRVVPDDDLPELPTGFAVVHRDVLGEWGLRTWLAQALSESRAASAAVGWDGDLLRVARRDDDAWRVDWAGVWDSAAQAEATAATLREALPHLLARLGPGGADVTVRVRGERLAVVATGRRRAE